MRLSRWLHFAARFPLFGKPIFWAVLVLIMFGLTSVTTASTLEDHDQFCASCHMQPEDTYDQRAQAVMHLGSVPADLASQHYEVFSDKNSDSSFRCIDCHRGDQGLGDRGTTLSIGANDLAIYFFGTPDQSLEKRSVTSPQVINNSCMACHVDTALTVGFPNHFHNKLPASYTAWRRGTRLVLPLNSPEKYQRDLEAGLELIRIDITCINCHSGHISKVTNDQAAFYDLATDIFPVCEDCHLSELGRELGLGIDEAP